MFCTNEEFVPPPECPVFEPTWDEFKDTMSYIEKIRAIGEKSGICKIRPPPEWQPPFVIDMDNFRFTPRVQKLNELEAQSRVKIIFLNGLAKFWELQGTQLKIPMVDRKYLDLCKLQKVVREEGGFVVVCNERKWARVANRLNYPPGKGISSTLLSHYERILYPYDLFLAGVTVDSAKKAEEVRDEGVKIIDLDYVPDEVETTKADPKVTSPKPESGYETRRSSRMNKDGLKSDVGASTSGASPVTLNSNTPQKKSVRVGNNKTSSAKEDEKKLSSNVADQYFCEVCSRGDMESLLLLCDGCDDAYHTFCLLPPMNEVPHGDWRCPKCVAKECHKPVEAYGFEQAEREYTLESFGEMADKFKMNHFKMPAHLVPTGTVEREFWRLVSCLDEDVVVEYGADIHAAERGSGFPTATNQAAVDDNNRMYIESGWNLNNLPVLPSSVLQYISVDISGMKVPWVYIGMCFSSFSWHTEDHWSYSVNYMHWGEPKTWYGVPGAKAELLEECMQKIAPELFEHSPDLLHQLTTILNPNVLMAYGVPISRTDQHAGEFVITFPRSYHAGFNQGFNCAEAVNFCPADWLPYGRASVHHYQELHRQCVFSNDELMCKMASVAETLDVSLARLIYEDLAPVFEEEKRLRKGFEARGLTKMEKESFELLQDDERQCNFCKTTCFLSSITCTCSPNRMVCLNHVDHICHCNYYKRCLRYQLTIEELDAFVSQLKNRSEAEDRWKRMVQGVMVSQPGAECHKPDLADLKNLIHEATQQKLPGNDELEMLTSVVQEAEKLQTTISQITGSKIRTRQRGNGSSKYTSRLKAEDLRSLYGSLDGLPCNLKEADALRDLLKRIEAFQNECGKVCDAVELPSSSVIQQLLNQSADFIDVDLEEVPKLNQVLAQAKWLEEVSLALKDRQMLSLADLSLLIENGACLAPLPSCEAAMAELQSLLTICQQLEQTASVWIKSWKETGNKLDRDLVEEMLGKAETVEAYLPGVESLRDFIGKADDWKAKALGILNRTHLLHLDDVELLVSKGAQIPLAMELHDTLNQKQNDARTWLLRINETLRSSHRQHSVLQQLLKRFLHQRNSPGHQESQSCSMLEEYLAIESGCRRELERMRKQNAENLAVEPGTIACCHVCKNEITKFRRKCPVCLDLCHAKCLLRKRSVGDHSNSVIACPSCCPSGHPKLDTIESLVASYRALGICLPVGEALSSLLSQSSKWRLAAAEALQSEDVSMALGKLNGTDSSTSSSGENWSGSSSCENMTDSSDVNQSDEPRDMLTVGLLVTLATAEHTYSAPSLADSDAGCVLKQATRKPVRRRLYPVVSLTEGSRILLNELIVEGWIIDVDMEEMVNISRLIYACVDGRTRKRKSVKDSEEKLQHKKRKIELFSNGDATSSSSKLSPEDKEIESLATSSVKGVGAESALAAAAAAGKTGKRRERKQKMHRKQEQKKESEDKSCTDGGSSDSEADPDELCSAGKCQRPTAKKVNWVQCDQCLLWFHLLCIGQTMNQISREKYYVCAKCIPRGSPPLSTTIVHCESSSTDQSGDSGSNVQPVTSPHAGPAVDHRSGLIVDPPVVSAETAVGVQQSAPLEPSPVLGVLQDFSPFKYL